MDRADQSEGFTLIMVILNPAMTITMRDMIVIHSILNDRCGEITQISFTVDPAPNIRMQIHILEDRILMQIMHSLPPMVIMPMMQKIVPTTHTLTRAKFMATTPSQSLQCEILHNSPHTWFSQFNSPFSQQFSSNNQAQQPSQFRQFLG